MICHVDPNGLVTKRTIEWASSASQTEPTYTADVGRVQRLRVGILYLSSGGWVVGVVEHVCKFAGASAEDLSVSESGWEEEVWEGIC